MKIAKGLLCLMFSIALAACTKELPEPNKVPVVNAGTNQTITLNSFTQNITLTGSASDADGSITGYSWTQVSGPNKANVQTPGAATTQVNGLVTGSYEFQLMATDDDGAVGVKNVSVAITQNGAMPAENILPVANAGNDATLTLTNATGDSIQLQGSATDADGTITSYVWSQVSGPTQSHIINPGSASTKVKGVVAGQYVYQLVVTDNRGATASKTVRITVADARNNTLTLQPHNSANDVSLGVVGTTNYGDPNSTELLAATWTNSGSNTIFRGLLKFDLAGLPAGAIITSARLVLYSNPNPINGDGINANYGTNNSMLLQRVSSTWTSTVTWQTQPATTTTNQVSVAHASQSMLDLDLDVTNLVKDMVQFGNHGFLFKLQNETAYNSRIFASSKYADAAKHPKLIITYSL